MPKPLDAIATFVFACAVALPVSAQDPTPPPVLAIENVTVIPMDSERVLGGQTVVIEGRRITARRAERYDQQCPTAPCASTAGGVS